MTIPLWVWPLLCLVCLLALSEYECWQINRKRDHFRDIEAERVARANSAPLGNVDRYWDWDFDREDAA